MTHTHTSLTILYVADANSTHTKMFCDYMHAQSNVAKVVVFSLTSRSILTPDERLIVEMCNFDSERSELSKLRSYIRATRRLREVISKYSPQVIHTHFATSYGLISALACPGRYLLSVWGSDVFVYPTTSRFWRWAVKLAMKRALRILSTSHAMAEECSRYTLRDVTVTPFGIDLTQFSPGNVPHPVFSHPPGPVLGIVKRLEGVAGVDILIKAVAKLEDHTLRLLIVGDGSERVELEDLVNDLGLSAQVHFTGRVPRSEIHFYHRQLNLAVYPSRHESFGVSILESMACGVPVVVTDVEGLPEITKNGECAFLAPSDDIDGLASTIKAALENPERLAELAQLGPKHVQENYSIESCMRAFQSLYRSLAS